MSSLVRKIRAKNECELSQPLLTRFGYTFLFVKAIINCGGRHAGLQPFSETSAAHNNNLLRKRRQSCDVIGVFHMFNLMP